MKKTLTFIFISLSLFIQAFAQQPPKIKFEKVTEEEMQMNVYAPDTSAVAVILSDDGSSEVRWDNAKVRFMLNHDRFVRIKILKQAGTKWGNFMIPIYVDGQNKETIHTIKGVTTNYENGKLVQTELKKDAIFRESENKYWDMVRLSLPSVKAGSVIDLKYSINSPMLWNLRSWKFQYDIPVKWSQYRVTYPEYFTYNQTSAGYHRLASNNKTSRRDAIGTAINFSSDTYEYTVKDVPALKEEPFLTTLDNYTTSMKFELSLMNLTSVGGNYKNFTTTWADIAKSLLENDNFGLQIKSANYASDDIAALLKGKTTEQQKMIALYSYIQHAIKWNGRKSYSTSVPLRKVFADKTGNSADINLLLAAMLKEAGINAAPVILSTRENGIISFVHPTLSDCNYVIVKAIIDGAPVLLDATELNLPAGLLPFRCLNGIGRLIQQNNVEEVELTNAKSSKNTIAFVKLEDGKFVGNITSRSSGLSAFNFREAVKEAGGEKEYFDKLKNKSNEYELKDYSITYLDSIYLPATRKYNIALVNEPADEEILYFTPVLVDRTTENPFTAPTRIYPVDFGTTSTDLYQTNLTIPEGYKVEELPQSKAFSLFGKSGSYIYQIRQTDSIITLSTKLTLDKTMFLPSEYEMLREFYNVIVAKESEQIVLKKIN